MNLKQAFVLVLLSSWACTQPERSGIPAFTLGLEDAELVIGSVDGPVETAFSVISDAMLLGDSAILIVDGMSQDFRVFDRQGRFQYQFGGRGGGPGEFRSVGRVHLRGDTVLVLDYRASKVARFLTSGEFLDTEATPFFMPDLVAVTGAGRLVWSHDYGARPGTGLVSEFRSSLSSSTGLSGDPSWISEFDEGWRFAEIPYPTTPIPSVVEFRDSVLVSDPDRGVLRLVAATDGGERTISVPLDRIDSEEAWNTIGAELMRRDLVDRARSLGDIPARPIPHFGMVLAEDDDHIWVKHYDPLEDAHWLGGWAGGEGGAYLVLDAEGRVIREVTLAMRAMPLRVQAGYLLARVRDELDVEYLALLSLSKFNG